MRGNNRTRRRVALTPLLFVHCLPQIGLSPQFYRQQISEIGVKTKRSDKDKARRGPGFSGVPMSGSCLLLTRVTVTWTHGHRKWFPPGFSNSKQTGTVMLNQV